MREKDKNKLRESAILFSGGLVLAFTASVVFDENEIISENNDISANVIRVRTH